MHEVEIAAILCAWLGGQTEVRHNVALDAGDHSIRVDCETATEVIEVGLDDKAGSRDLLVQALFAADLTGKTPVVILIDRDGVEDKIEYQVRRASVAAGVRYEVRDVDALIRWQMGAYFRSVQIAPGS